MKSVIAHQAAPLGASKVDSASAAKRQAAAHDHEGFISAAVLHQLIGPQEGALHLGLIRPSGAAAGAHGAAGLATFRLTHAAGLAEMHFRLRC